MPRLKSKFLIKFENRIIRGMKLRSILIKKQNGFSSPMYHTSSNSDPFFLLMGSIGFL
ncbi:hypothetical protein Hanom_Chr03g00186181 [Helianthus anomalus]